jgi:hypothetical protein
MRAREMLLALFLLEFSSGTLLYESGNFTLGTTV